MMQCSHAGDTRVCVNRVIVRVHIDCPDPEDTTVEHLCGEHLADLVAEVANDITTGAPAPDLSISAYVR